MVWLSNGSKISKFGIGDGEGTEYVSRLMTWLFLYTIIWSNYFRTLTLAKIERTLGLEQSSRYKFYSLPGWGYY